MNVYLYRPDGEQDNHITFYMPHTTNGVIVYLFKMDATESTTDKTRLVSGYENSRPINMQITLGAHRDAYVISCVRAPCLFRELFVHNKYTAPLGFMIVRAASGAPETWHVLGVSRRTEVKRTRNIKGLRVHSNRGADVFYPKVLFSLRGNVPAGFLNNLQRCRANHKDIDVLTLLCADLRVDDSPVQFDMN